MPQDVPEPKELGRLFALAQVGLEMVAPIGLGLMLDNYFSWTPWGTIAGAVFGLVGGLSHLVILLNRQDVRESSQRGQDPR